MTGAGSTSGGVPGAGASRLRLVADLVYPPVIALAKLWFRVRGISVTVTGLLDAAL